MRDGWLFTILICLGLGLAPWWLDGEPHIVGKVRWVLGGAKGMATMDWFDLVLHGAPWLFLFWKIFKELILKKSKKE